MAFFSEPRTGSGYSERRISAFFICEKSNRSDIYILNAHKEE
jgi:hypothetical protein